MTINISWYGELGPANPRYAALSENDKRFLCPQDLLSDMSIPTLMIMTHIGFITEESIPHIIGRIDFANLTPIKDRLEARSIKEGYASLADHLRVFIGVSSNWPSFSKAEFVRRIAEFEVPSLTAKGIQRMISKRNRLQPKAAA